MTAEFLLDGKDEKFHHSLVRAFMWHVWNEKGFIQPRKGITIFYNVKYFRKINFLN
jgi:hypothetical protein